ncbi:hypothetical protein A9Q83_04220 [Alphaproteobacteria bacterium 46_93_T64]|nr:hypothetical protein A9Q83_04220 [Alphaproteobacteria bacterium 46_93_T64]
MNYQKLLESWKNKSANEIEIGIEHAKKHAIKLSDKYELEEAEAFFRQLITLLENKLTDSKKQIRGYPGYFYRTLSRTGVGKWNEIFFENVVFEIINKTDTHGSTKTTNNYSVENLTDLNNGNLTNLPVLRARIAEAHKTSQYRDL